MKSYLSEQRIHLVGKAWEVRRFLQVLMRDAASPDQTLPHYLAKFNRAGSAKCSAASRSTAPKRLCPLLFPATR